jgi:hypothetical protein
VHANAFEQADVLFRHLAHGFGLVRVGGDFRQDLLQPGQQGVLAHECLLLHVFINKLSICAVNKENGSSLALGVVV